MCKLCIYVSEQWTSYVCELLLHVYVFFGKNEMFAFMQITVYFQNENPI